MVEQLQWLSILSVVESLLREQMIKDSRLHHSFLTTMSVKTWLVILALILIHTIFSYFCNCHSFSILHRVS
jgi:hypothetical protein